MRGPVGAGGWPLLGFLAASMNLPRRFHSFVPFSGVLSRDERRGKRAVLAAATPAASPPLSRRPMLMLIASLETRQMRGEKVRTSDSVGPPESCLPHPQTPSHTTTLKLFPPENGQRNTKGTVARAGVRTLSQSLAVREQGLLCSGPGSRRRSWHGSCLCSVSADPWTHSQNSNTHPRNNNTPSHPVSTVRKRPDAAHSVPRFPCLTLPSIFAFSQHGLL